MEKWQNINNNYSQITTWSHNRFTVQNETKFSRIAQVFKSCAEPESVRKWTLCRRVPRHTSVRRCEENTQLRSTRALFSFFWLTLFRTLQFCYVSNAHRSWCLCRMQGLNPFYQRNPGANADVAYSNTKYRNICCLRVWCLNPSY